MTRCPAFSIWKSNHSKSAVIGMAPSSLNDFEHGLLKLLEGGILGSLITIQKGLRSWQWGSDDACFEIFEAHPCKIFYLFSGVCSLAVAK